MIDQLLSGVTVRRQTMHVVLAIHAPGPMPLAGARVETPGREDFSGAFKVCSMLAGPRFPGMSLL